MTDKDDHNPQADAREQQRHAVTPALDLIVDEHEEEVSEDGHTVRRKGVYLLPNLFTTGALFAGFYAVVSAMRGDFENAAVAIFFALVLDGLDGRIARMTNTCSKFGAEYDSLSDMVSFGVAPALVMFSWALGELGKFGWSAAFVYVACAALRLARFNTQIETADTHNFTGLPSPAAAAVVASTMWTCWDMGWVGGQLPAEVAYLVAVMTAILGLLMMANFPYYSFKDVDLRSRVPFVVIILVVLVISLVILNPPTILLVTFLVYALSGPFMQLKRWRKGASPAE